MKIAAIDPGTYQSAIIVLDTASFSMDMMEIGDNEHILGQLRVLTEDDFSILLIERIASYGMPVGKEVFDTCFWTGRFIEAWNPGRTVLITRNAIKNALCHTSKAKDAHVAQAIRDIMASHHGMSDKQLKGTKKNKGPLYGIKSHMWSALAVAIAWTIENYPRTVDLANIR